MDPSEQPRSVNGEVLTEPSARTAEDLRSDLSAVIDGLRAGTITPAEANARTRAINAEIVAVGSALRAKRLADKLVG